MITTAAMCPRKLALYTTSNAEWSTTPDSAYVEIGAEQAQAIIDLLVMATQFRTQADRAGLLSPFYSVTAGTGERIPNFRLIRIPFADDAQLSSEHPVIVLPDGFSPDTVPADDECRVECHRVEIAHSQVRFTALAKHGAHHFTTADLDLQLLRAIADDRNDGLPHARLNSTAANG